MSIKNFFKENKKGSVTTENLQNSTDVESYDNVKAVLEDNKELVPTVDYTNPKSFAKYGSAKLYYVNAIQNVYKNYPYDGSKKEKQEWYNSLAYFEKYLFDHDYPKTTGYVTLGSSSWNLYSSSSITDGVNTYPLSNLPQYIYIRPSTNQSVAGRNDPEKNVYNTTAKRGSSLLLDKNDGNTVEFWFKEGTNSPSTYALFDVWNSASIADSSYERLLIEVVTGSGFYLTYQKGTSGVSRAFVDVGYSTLKSSWHHYAFCFKSNDTTDNVDIKVYVDAKSDLSSNSAIYSVSTGSAINSDFGTTGMNANLGAYIYSPVSSLTASVWNGRGSVHGSFDEFRFWNVSRNHEEIGKNWSFPVGGGANTDESNRSLNLYYKFNEGIIDSNSTDQRDSIILDYSGRFANSLIKNYTAGIRNTGSAMESSTFFDFNEEKDPIIIEVNPRLTSYLSTKESEGYEHDTENTSQAYNLLPNWIREEDEATNKDLKNVFQIVSTYFDKLYLQIDQLNKLKHIDYQTDKQKAYPFAKELLESKGLLAPDVLIDSTILEEISSRNEERPYEEKFNIVKNLIYQNIYNNLTYVYKSKGTEKAFRNLFRAFGVDDEIIKIVLYSNNGEIRLNKDKINYTSAKTNLIDFSHKENHNATVYQYATGSNSSVLYGANTTNLELIPQTFECITYIPNQEVKEKLFKWNLNSVSSSIFGVHSALNTNNDLTWDSDDKFNFQVYAIRDAKSSKGGRFVLKTNGFGLTSGITLTSSYYNDLYDNTLWNLAVKVRPAIDDYSYLNVDSINPENYVIEFIGVQSNFDTIQNEFSVSYNLNAASSSLAMQKNKRVYVGAHLNNFTGSVLEGSDVRIITARYWYDDLDSATLKAHARNFKAFGRNNPSKLSFLGLFRDVLQLETLALNWDFDTVSGSDTNGQFIVEDRKTYDTSNLLSFITNEKHYGRGDYFEASSTNPVDVDYLSIGKNELPEQLSTSDTIDIRNEDDIFFTKDTRPVEYFLSLENSMYSIISDEMLNMFSSVTDYSNLIGNPLNIYKQDYKELAFLRQKFFEKVDNIPSFERYLNLFKWIDTSINDILKQVVPASANVSEDISTILESHIFERNKYQRKLPIFNYREKTRVNFPIKGINELLNTPISGTDLWLKDRLEKNNPLITSGDSSADYNRQTIQNSLNNLNDQKTFKLKDELTSSYLGQVYAFRKLAKPYRFMVDTPESPTDSISSSANIQNIPSTASNVYSGRQIPYNYREPYEVFQTSGRTTNNKYLNDISQSLTTKNVESTNPTATVVYLDKEAPERTIQKTVFVEKFSAPGGPETNAVISLNEDSAEFSVYNSTNYRNLLARKNLNAWSAESSSVTDAIPSYHKIPKNPKYGLNDEITYDNLFIQQSIPQSDKANSWIRSALAKAITTEPQIKTQSEKTFALDGISAANSVYNYRIKFLSSNQFFILYKTNQNTLKISLFNIVDEGREKNIELVTTKKIEFFVKYDNYELEIINYEKPIILITIQNKYSTKAFTLTVINNQFKYIKIKRPNANTFSDVHTLEPSYWQGLSPYTSYQVIGYPSLPLAYLNISTRVPVFEPMYSIKRLKEDVFVAGNFQYKWQSSTTSEPTGSGYTLFLSKINYSSDLATGSYSTSSFLRLSPFDTTRISTEIFTSFYGLSTNNPLRKIDILPLTDNSFIATYGQDSTYSTAPTVTTGTVRTTYFTLINYNTSSMTMTEGAIVTSSLMHAPYYDLVGFSGSYAYYSAIYTKRTGSISAPYNYTFGQDKNVYLKFLKFNKTNITDFTSSNEITIGITDYIGTKKFFETEYKPLTGYEYGLSYKYNLSCNTILTSKNDLQTIESDKFVINYSFLSSSTAAFDNSGDNLNDQNIFGYVTGSLSNMTLSNPINTYRFLDTQSFNVKIFTLKNSLISPNFLVLYNSSGLTNIEYCSIADDEYFKLYVDEEKYLNEPETLVKRELFKNYSAFYNSFPNLSGDEFFIYKEQLFDPIVDFCGTNIALLKNYDPDTNTISLYSSEDSLKMFLANMNGFYGFNTWKQIRNNQNIIQVKKARSNKYFIDQKNYNEPVITYKKPLEVNVLTDTKRLEDFNEEKSVKSHKMKVSVPYLSSHEYFANKDLQEKTNPEKSFGGKLKETKYDSIKETYSVEDSHTELDYISLTENLFPKSINTSTARLRKNYEEEKNTGSNGYERDINSVRTFWKDDLLKRYKEENHGLNNLGYKNEVIKEDSNNNLKRGLFFVNSSSNGYIGYNIEKAFSIWPLDNFFLYNESPYTLEEYSDLLSSSITYSVDNKFYTDVETNTLNAIGDIAFPGHSEERKLTYLIPQNLFGIKSTPRTQFIFNPYINGINYEPFGWDWKTHTISGKNPWYDSYDDYSNELRLINKNYSVLPEYKISDHVVDYLNSAISVINKQFLKLDGVSISSSYIKNTTETVLYPAKVSANKEQNLANNNFKYNINNFNLSTTNTASAVNINLKTNSSRKADYAFNRLPNSGQYITFAPGLIIAPKFLESTSLILNNTGSESYLETDIKAVSTSSLLSSSSGIYAPNMNTASFTVSTWFKISHDAYVNKTPLGLWYFSNVDSTVTNSFDQTSFGVLLNTSGTLLGENFNSGSVYADTDIVVYNNGPHDSGIDNRNIYTFYNNSSSILGNNDFPETKILLDDKWHNLVVEYFTPEQFNNSYARDQIESKIPAHPYETSGYTVYDNLDYPIIKNILLKKNIINYPDHIEEENTIAVINLLTDGSPSSTTSGALGISIYKNIGDSFIKLDAVSVPFTDTFHFSDNTDPYLTFDAEYLGTKDDKEYFITNVQRRTTQQNVVNDYIICSFSSSIETGSFGRLESTSPTNGYPTSGIAKPLQAVKFINNSASSVLTVHQYTVIIGGSTFRDFSSSMDYYDVDYTNKTLVNKKNILNITSSFTPLTNFRIRHGITSIQPCLVDQNGSVNSKFIYSFTTGSSATVVKYLELDSTGSILKNQDIINLPLFTTPDKLYYITSSFGANQVDNYIFENLTSLAVMSVYDGTGSVFTSSRTNTISINDIYGYQEKIIGFGWGTSTSSYVYATASYGASPNLSGLTASSLYGDLEDLSERKIYYSSFPKTKTPDRRFNYSSSSFSIPMAYTDLNDGDSYLTNAKYNRNRGTNASLRVYLDGQPKYGKYFDTSSTNSTLRPILINQPYKEDTINKQKEFNLNKLKIGYTDNMQYITSALGFNGEIDEFSAWYGNLGSSSVLKLYNSSSHQNLNELSFYLATQSLTDSTVFESASYMPSSITGNIFIWYRLGVAETTSSIVTNNYTFNNSFYDLYSISDDLSYYKENNNKKTHYSRLLNENTTSVQKITLTVNGITKLLPYNGFYPVQRTAQIGKSLKNSFASFNQQNIKNNTLTLSSLDTYGKNNGYNKNINDESVIQAAIQPFMAPGILFNSIKSGISVDWAAFTGSYSTITAKNKPNFYNFASSNGTGSYIVSSGSALRIPFESLTNLQKFPKRANSSFSEPIYYLNPTIYSFTSTFENSQNNGDSKFTLTNTYPYFIWNGTKLNDEFELSINNFLAETPRFFLKDGTLTNFKSKLAKEFKSAVSGNLYVMDISLYKTKNFSMIIPPKASSSYEVSSSSGRYFGPPVNYKSSANIGSFADVESIIADPAYAPYTPPYYYGKSVIRLKYRADKARVTVDDIISKLEYEIINTELDDLFTETQGSTNSVSYLNRMTIDSSLQLKGKEIVPTSVKNGFIEIQASNDPVNAAENTKWVISTKWECPTMNFNDENATNKAYDSGDLTPVLNSNVTWSYPTAGTGIWSGYSKDYNENEGIFLKLEESFAGNISSTTGSLIDLCGFQVAEKRIGTLAETKEISEAVVIMPYYEKSLYTEVFDVNSGAFKRLQNKNEINVIDEKHEFIKLNKDQFIKGVKYIAQNKNEIDTTNPPNSLIDLALKMEKYELPRHLDFLKDIKENKQLAIYPSAMYIFEFNRKLSRDELGDIWQGVMPESALIAKKDSITISHPFTDTELLSSIDKPENLKWLVFKVKRKAEKFYDSLTDFSDERFKPINQETGQNALYNWPYDYFSLVELANVEVKFDIYNDEFYDVERREVVINPQQTAPELVSKRENILKVNKDNLLVPKKLELTNLVESINSSNNAKKVLEKIIEKKEIIQQNTNKILNLQKEPIAVLKPMLKQESALVKETVLTDSPKLNNKIVEKQQIIEKPKLEVKTPLLDKVLNTEKIAPQPIVKQETIKPKLAEQKKSIFNKKKG